MHDGYWDLQAYMPPLLYRDVCSDNVRSSGTSIVNGLGDSPDQSVVGKQPQHIYTLIVRSMLSYFYRREGFFSVLGCQYRWIDICVYIVNIYTRIYIYIYIDVRPVLSYTYRREGFFSVLGCQYHRVDISIYSEKTCNCLCPLPFLSYQHLLKLLKLPTTIIKDYNSIQAPGHCQR